MDGWMDGWLNQVNIYFIDPFQKTILLQQFMQMKKEKNISVIHIHKSKTACCGLIALNSLMTNGINVFLKCSDLHFGAVSP